MRMRRFTIRGGVGAVAVAAALLIAACSTVNPPGGTEPVADSAASATAPAAADSAVASIERPAPASAPVAAESAVPAPVASAPAGTDTIIVTGTRIRRDDFSSAQATTVITAEGMQALDVVSVADMVNQLPDSIAAVSPDATESSPFYLGASIADLRGLNTAYGVRTLTLLDSRRMTPTDNADNAGGVDLNFIPSALVGQTETVTGGASATYGADAMAGAVEVILDGDENADEEAPRLSPEAEQAREAELRRLDQERAAELARQQEAARRLAEYQQDQRQAAEQAAARFSQRSPLSRVSPGEELWIIGQPEDLDSLAPVAWDALGPGVMLARFMPAVVDDIQPPQRAAMPREVPLPLKHTDVAARIQGYVGTVDVTQQFENPYAEKIEAVYLFPLPEKAAVSEFVMTIGERRIRGILRDHVEAQVIYEQARAQGYRASLLTQHRPNVFEQKVANIEPGKQIDVNITYYETLDYVDGWYSFVFPTVVGPRYNPPGSTDPLLALPRTDFRTTAADAVRYLTPGTYSRHDLSISVELDAGVAIEAIESSHELDTSTDRDGVVRAALADGAVVPNVDFRLDFKVAGDTIKSNLLTYVDDETDQGYFTLMLYPPAELNSLRRQPLELVFVLDSSGSMSGEPIEQAKSAIVAALDRLGPDDSFQIIRFSDRASQFGPEPMAATADNIRAARRFVRDLQGMGGTQMIEGIRAALDFPHDAKRLRFVTFLTDGYIGNEAQILAAIDAGLGDARIFSFGVGSSPNRYLLERMASTGRGAVAYLSLTDSGGDVMDAFFDRIAHPAMIDVGVDWGGMAVSDVYPSRLPDLFVGRPVIVTGRFSGRADDIALSGRAAGQNVAVALDYDRRAPQHAFLPNLWARLRIAELNDRLAVEPAAAGPLSRQIRNTALAYQLMSDYTSFVAVDAAEATRGSRGTTIHQAVPVPDGVSYETTVAR